MENHIEKIAELEKELEKERCKNQCIKSLEDSLKQKEVQDARREMLVGAAILSAVDSGEWPRDRLMAILDQKLIRLEDRALFDLAPVHRKNQSTQ